jgi:hypothetical protein
MEGSCTFGGKEACDKLTWAYIRVWFLTGGEAEVLNPQMQLFQKGGSIVACEITGRKE